MHEILTWRNRSKHYLLYAIHCSFTLHKKTPQHIRWQNTGKLPLTYTKPFINTTITNGIYMKYYIVEEIAKKKKKTTFLTRYIFLKHISLNNFYGITGDKLIENPLIYMPSTSYTSWQKGYMKDLRVLFSAACRDIHIGGHALSHSQQPSVAQDMPINNPRAADA